MINNLFDRVQHISFFGLLVVVTAAFLYLISDFILPIVWAIVLAIIFYPLAYRLTREFGGRPGIAAFVTMLTAVLLVFLPIALMGTVVVKESTDLYRTAALSDRAELTNMIQKIPLAAGILEIAGINPTDFPIKIAETLHKASGALASEALHVGVSSIRFIAKALVMLYLLFFLLKDGPRIGSAIMRALPLGDAKEIFLYEHFATTVRATVKGTLIVALAQGAIGSILFAIAGIPSPILWGLVMALLALIPGVGPAVVWVPAVIIMYLLGNALGALIILVGGIALLSTIDNFLRPILMGRDTNMPDALILLSVLGGIGAFGISGIILGPAIAALFLAAWQLFEEQYKNELADRG